MAFPFFVFMESQVRDEAEALGVEIYPGFAASEVLIEGDLVSDICR